MMLFCLMAGWLVAPYLHGQDTVGTQSPGKLRIAACQFPVSASITDNARWIMDQMTRAADSGADIVQFPECALSGYPGVDMETLENLDQEELQKSTRDIMDLADKLDLWVLLGSVHWLGDGYRPMNSLYVVNPEGRIADRYDKRFCTRDDLQHFSAGDHPVVFEVNGVRCGVLICFDVRFPELYRDYCRKNVDVIFQSFYNARQKPGGIHPLIMPVTAQARAATNHFYLSLTNSCAPSSWPCHFITPDGRIGRKLEADLPGILVSEIDLQQDFYDASRHFRDRALEGDLSSGAPPEHARYLDRTCL